MSINRYTIKELLALEIEYNPLIDKILYVGDLLLIKARSKTGKSVIVQQLAYALSSGQDFLDAFKTCGCYKVAYISGEGFIGNWKKRFIDMARMWNVNNDNIDFFELKSIGLQNDSDRDMLLEELRSTGVKYDVFIFDPIYSLLHGGSINESKEITMFTNNIDMIKSEYDATAIVVHHDSEKEYVTKDGKKHTAHHSTAMGSSFTIAAMTHSYTLTKYALKNGKKMHKLQLGVERGGWAVEELDLFMVTPQEDANGRLGFTLDHEDTNVNYHIIKEYISCNGRISDHKPYKEIKVPSATFYRNIKKMIGQGFVKKEIDDNGKGWYAWVTETTKGDSNG